MSLLLLYPVINYCTAACREITKETEHDWSSGAVTDLAVGELAELFRTSDRAPIILVIQVPMTFKASVGVIVLHTRTGTDVQNYCTVDKVGRYLFM